MVINNKTEEESQEAKISRIRPIIYGSREENDDDLAEEQELTAQEITKIKHDVLEEINQENKESKNQARPASLSEAGENKETAKSEKVFKKTRVLKKKIQLSKFFKKKKTESPQEPKISKLPKFKKFIFRKFVGNVLKSFVLFLVFLVIITTIGLYLAGWSGSLAQTVTKLIPFPAVYVNGDFIVFNEFLVDAAALDNYLRRNKFSFTAEQVRNKAISSLIEKQIIEQLAEEYKVQILDNEVEEELNKTILNQSTKEQLNQLVAELYGWDFNHYVDKVIKPLVLSKKVSQFFYQDSDNLGIKQNIDSYYNQLLQSPADFESLALEVNQDETKATAGDLGWFKLGEFIPEVELALLSLEEGKFSEVIETQQGYYIIKLEEKLLDEENRPYFHARQIFLSKASFQEFLDEQIKKATIVTLIKI